MDLPGYIAGEPVRTGPNFLVEDPYRGAVVGTMAMAGPDDVDRAVQVASGCSETLSRWQRYEILDRARMLLEERADGFADLIMKESGLCLRETRYEVDRALDVLRFSSMVALDDDGRAYAGDVSPRGQARRIFTVTEPLGPVLAITPFNHPLNQVVHKLGPAIAAATPVLLKPSEKTPMTAIRFAELLYEAGLPGRMLSVFPLRHSLRVGTADRRRPPPRRVLHRRHGGRQTHRRSRGL